MNLDKQTSRNSSDTSVKRIAVLGFALESNAFAPVATRKDFEALDYAEGPDMLELSYVHAQISASGKGFGKVMAAHCEWQAIPVLFATAGASGPCDHAFFETVVAKIQRGLRDAGRLDGIYIIGHGAGITTELDDMDGAYFTAVREVVGPQVPIIATLDLHGNISESMVTATDILIAFQTNPHLDMVERSADAARLMIEMFAGMQPNNSFIRLPLVSPQVSQLTGAGRPYGDLILKGQSYLDSTIANVSILSGFAFSDTQHNGLAIIVTARNDQKSADNIAQELAESAWNDRRRYTADLISLKQATDLARNSSSPIILADVADNPGGGGRGNTTWILAALYAAKAERVQIGVMFDPDLVDEAWSVGKGNTFKARFTRNDPQEWSQAFTAEATVITLVDKPFVGERGLSKGQDIYFGRSCLLKIEGIFVALISIRQQILASEDLELFGLNPGEAKCIVVKSRGHFRAGFSHLIEEQHIYHVDVPGLATPNLKLMDWNNLPRPVFPLDADTQWP